MTLAISSCNAEGPSFAAFMSTPPSTAKKAKAPKKAMAGAAKPQQAPASALSADHAGEIIASAGRCARVALALVGILTASGRPDLAQLAEVVRMEAEQSQERLRAGHDGPTIMEVISSAERASQVALSLHGLLQGSRDEARLAWVLFLEASASAESMGGALGLDVVTE